VAEAKQARVAMSDFVYASLCATMTSPTVFATPVGFRRLLSRSQTSLHCHRRSIQSMANSAALSRAVLSVVCFA
jgi:hypothetical protein